MRQDVDHYVSNCEVCARLKLRTGSRYGLLPLKDTRQEPIPWDTVNVDSIGPWSFIDHTGKERTLTALTMIDPSTGLFELVRTCKGDSLEASQLFDINWLCRYPRPRKVICDQGSEFKLEFKVFLKSHKIAY